MELLDHKNIGLDTKNHRAKWFSSKVMIKNVFLQNGCQINALAYVSYADLWRYFLVHLNALIQAALC